MNVYVVTKPKLVVYRTRTEALAAVGKDLAKRGKDAMSVTGEDQLNAEVLTYILTSGNTDLALRFYNGLAGFRAKPDCRIEIIECEVQE